MRGPKSVAFGCDVVEPPEGPRGQEVRGRSVVRAPGTARLPRGEVAGGAGDEVGWCDLRRYPARRGGGAGSGGGGGGGGGGGAEQLLLDSQEEEPTAMSRQLRAERDHVSRCDLQEQRDFRDLRDLRDRDPRDLRDYRDRDIRDDRDDVERVRDDYLDYDHHPTAASTSALTNNPVSFCIFRSCFFTSSRQSIAGSTFYAFFLFL